jgi:hypothetical protein
MKAGLPLADHPDPTPSFFQQQWQIYRKFVDNNYFYHREVYFQLHRILVDEAVWPFSGQADLDARNPWCRRRSRALSDLRARESRRRGPRRLVSSLGAPKPAVVDGVDARGI